MQATSGNIRAKNTKSITASTHSGGIKIENIVEKCDISATSGNVILGLSKYQKQVGNQR